jgi:hypothetical protein
MNPAPAGFILNDPNIFILKIYVLQRKLLASALKMPFFYFQLATGGIESAVYKKLIAPFKNDLPVSYLFGFRMVCDEHKYAFLGPDLLKAKFMSLPCPPVPLPEPTYRETWAFIIPKNSPYKGLINCR